MADGRAEGRTQRSERGGKRAGEAAQPPPARDPRAARSARPIPSSSAARRYGRELGAGPRVRVVVWLDRQQLEDLKLIVCYRHGPATRSAIVREAVDWLRVREATWLIRARRQAQRQAREEAELRQAMSRSAEERRHLEREQIVAEAVRVAREAD